MLGLLGKLDATLRQAVDDFDYNTYVRALTDFCNEDLSAFFFDIRKDSLYCDAPSDPKRRAYRTVLDVLFHALVRYGAPVLVFTAEEVWSSRYPESDSVHLLEWPEVPGVGDADELIQKWSHIRELRSLVFEPIEQMRRDKAVGSGLEAIVHVRHKDALLVDRVNSVDFTEICIAANVQVSGFTDDGVENLWEIVSATRSTDHKCGRCWRLLPEVTEDGALCGRCDDVVTQIDTSSAAGASA